MDEQNSSLKDEVKKLNENFNRLIESGKVKGVKAKKLGRSERKKGYIRYLYINENRDIKCVKVPVDEGLTWYDKVPRLATTDYMLTWDGDPCIIQGAWSVEPFSPVQNYNEAVKSQMTSAGYRLLKKAMEEGEVKAKKKIPGALIFGIVIVVIIAGYLLLRK